MMFPYVVRAGDHLQRLAFRFGFDAEEVWQDPKNEALRRVRGDGNILEPGDIIYVPQRPDASRSLEAGQSNTYLVNVPTVTVTVVFLWKGRPLANAAYSVRELPDLEGKTTDGSGTLTAEVPVTYRSITVDFKEPLLTQILRIGHLDPVSSRGGIWQRLANLGHLRTIDTHAGKPNEAELRVALRRFQWANGLPITGVADEETCAKLESIHGS